MFTWMVAACTFCSGAVVALVPFQRLGLDEQWLVSPGNISVPQFRLRALRPVSADGRPLLFSCSAATAEPANISWDVSMDSSSVISVDSRWGRFNSVVVVDSLISIQAPTSVRNASVACRITRPDGRQVALKTSLEGTADNLRQAAAYGEMGHECARRERCKSPGAICRPSLLDRSLLCGCPTNKSAYDRFYDVCHQGQALHRVALISSVLITLMGVALAVASLLGNLRQRCCEGTGAHEDATFKIPEWAEPDSYYMSTRFWVSEQPYYAMDHREARLPPKKYFSW